MARIKSLINEQGYAWLVKKILKRTNGNKAHDSLIRHFQAISSAGSRLQDITYSIPSVEGIL